MDFGLVQKYDLPVPRYTSYPTVPMWDNEETDGAIWMKQVLNRFENNRELSLYVHLPYCESLCTYCGCNKHITKNHLVEKPYIEAVLREWFMYTSRMPQKPVLRELHLGGGTPTFFSPENLQFLVEGLKAEAEVPEKHDFSFEAHPSSTSYEHLKALREVGFNRLSLGIQDFDQHILRVINRQQDTAQVERITKEARKIGYQSINFDLIYGLPFQNEDNIIKNLAWVKRLQPDRIAFYSYAHVPGVKPSQRAYSETDLPKGEEKWKLYQKGKAGFLKLGYQDIGMDHFALQSDSLSQSLKKHHLHRNFMGYTSNHSELVLALGASSISDSWSAYVQNEKTIAGYLRRIRNESFPPIVKSHYLTEEDQVIRSKLLRLICHFEADWFDQPEFFAQELEPQFLNFEKDGLLKVFPNHIKVTTKGKGFIRNICAVLDKRWQNPTQPNSSPSFSQAI